MVKLIEDDQLRDELPNEDTDETDEEDYTYWNHTYTTNLPETREILKEFHDFLIEYGNVVGRETWVRIEYKSFCLVGFKDNSPLAGLICWR